MIIRSSRIRRVETPDEPTPGAVPPVVPPVTPPPVVPAADAAPAAAAPAPGAPKKTSKGLIIGLIAGGAVLVIAAIIAVVALVLPMIFGGGSGDDTTDVADISDEPDTTWKYDWVGDADSDFLYGYPTIVSVGDDTALISSTFDYSTFSSSQGDSAGWYEGYDEQYEDGYAAGLEYKDAYDAWLYDDTYTVDLPDEEDYFPEGAYDNYDDYLGFQDGFYDAAYEFGEGYSQKVKPVDPDYTPTLALLNVANGDEEWNVDLSDAIDGVDYASTFQAYEVEGADFVVLSSSITDGDDTSYVVATLAKSDGKVIDTFESDDAIYGVTSLDGNVIITTTSDDGEDSTVSLFNGGKIGDKPKWDADVDGTAYTYADNGYVFVSGDDNVVLNASDGDEAEFSDDDAQFGFLGSQLIRSESDGDSSEIEGWGTNGKSTWEDSVKNDYVGEFDGVILSAEADGDEYTDLQRINPSNGTEMWSETYGDNFDGIAGVQGSNLLVYSGSKIVVLDLGNGEEKFSQKVGGDASIYEGTNFYYAYTGDELAAYSYGEKGDVWTFDIDDDQYLDVAGNHFVLTDSDTIYGLGKK